MKRLKYVMKQTLKFFGEKLVLTCKQGPLKGFRLLAVVPMRFLKGSYEPERTEAFINTVKNGHIVYDIGAHMGYYTLIASRLVGPLGRVFAFEPHPYNLRILRRHLELNSLTNCVIIPAAVSDQTGKAKFAFGTGTGTGHLADLGEIEVKTVCIDDLMARGELLPPNVIKIDVEGAEIKVLKGALKTIQTYCPTIFLAAHNPSLLKCASELLLPLGYKCFTLKYRCEGDIEVKFSCEMVDRI